MTMKPNTELNTMMFFDDALEGERTQLLTELADAVSETRTAADQAAELNEDGEPRFELYVDGDLVYCGFLQIRPQYKNYVYACNEYDSCGYMCWFDCYDALHIEFDLNGNSCVFVPEGTVPGWAVDTEIGNGEFSDIAGIWMEMRMQLQRC